MLAIDKKVRELSGVRPDEIPPEVLSSVEPLVLKGLVAGWPCVRKGHAGKAELLSYLRRYCRDADIPVDVFEAVLARHPTRPLDFNHRLQAVAAFKSLAACESLAAANKRVRNILRQAAEKGISVPDAHSDKLLEETAEKSLSAAVNDMAGDITTLVQRADYTEALTRLAALREPVDTFFDDVLVMADDERLRDNRLALLARMNRLFLGIADVSQLQH